MVNNPPSKIRDEGYMLGWPIDWVTDQYGTFLGFVMPLGFSGSKELVNLTVYGMSKKLRDDEEWRKRYDLTLGRPALLARLKLMCNIAIPIHILHSTGKYVLVDFKPQNVLVTKDGRVTLVDMDSIQIASGNHLLHPGTAYTPEYQPPEYSLKGVGKSKTIPIDKSWDNFTLGVVFYQLLFGIHPYIVIPHNMPSDGNCGPVQNIPKGLFPFGKNAHLIKTVAPQHQHFRKLPKVLQDMFIRTFTDNTKNRPNADEWGRVIHRMIQESGKNDISDETVFWNQCNPNDKYRLQEYLRKYPNGRYASQARLLISNLDNKERERVVESRVFNCCLIKEDYIKYLQKYPKGRYVKEANAKIKELETFSDSEKEKDVDRFYWIIWLAAFIGAVFGFINGGIGLAIVFALFGLCLGGFVTGFISGFFEKD